MSATGRITLISSPYDTVKLILEQAQLYDEAMNLKALEVTCELHDLHEDRLKLVEDALKYWGVTSVTLSY